MKKARRAAQEPKRYEYTEETETTEETTRHQHTEIISVRVHRTDSASVHHKITRHVHAAGTAGMSVICCEPVREAIYPQH